MIITEKDRERQIILSFSTDMQTNNTVRNRRNITGNEKEFIRLNVSRNIRLSAYSINLDIVYCLFNKFKVLFFESFEEKYEICA